MCNCYGAYSVLINQDQDDHIIGCKYYVSPISKKEQKKKRRKEAKLAEIQNRPIPLINGINKDVWIKIFEYVVGNIDYSAMYSTTMIKGKTIYYKLYHTYDEFPSVYFLRLVCRSFRHYVDEYNKINKRFMLRGLSFYKNPFVKWKSYYGYRYDYKQNPYRNRPFIRPLTRFDKLVHQDSEIK